MKKILLVGAGQMAIEYARVLKKMGINPTVVGRGKQKSLHFKKETNLEVEPGGINKWIVKNKGFKGKAMVAVGERELGTVTQSLLSYGIKSILVEKPGGFNFAEIIKIEREAKKKNAEVYVGYNRRFYTSVLELEKIIREDKGIKSFIFDFTEWSFEIKNFKKARGVKEKWFLHNSTHLVDLAFFIAGFPKIIHTQVKGSLTWHHSGSIYTGCGVTNNSTPFSYHANWDSPGRWGIEILTKKHKLILRPLEKLYVQDLGTLDIYEKRINDKIDINFKPGLFREVKAFLGDKKRLCSIQEQVKNINTYKKISNEI